MNPLDHLRSNPWRHRPGKWDGGGFHLERRIVLTSVLVSFLVLPAFAQLANSSAAVEGFVRNAHGDVIVGAAVNLKSETGDAQTASTDRRGAYRFAALLAGSYTLQASVSGCEQPEAKAFSLQAGETKHIDLTLSPRAAKPGKPSPPEFSDEPSFTVAGVIDASTLGGHGSDAAIHNGKALAKATASLADGMPGPSPSSAEAAQKERALRLKVEQDPQNYEANLSLGKLLASEAKPEQAIPYLERAAKLRPDDYIAPYQIAVAHFHESAYDLAYKEVTALLGRHDRAELHHLLAEVEEKRNRPLEAVEQYQLAAELDRSEQNFFDWGTELLLHQAPQPAVEVFKKGSLLFPHSVRMIAGFGIALYAAGSYEHAVQALCQASDLDPRAISPYVFLGMIQNAEASENPALTAKLARFAELFPSNALANYYYAASLWKHHRAVGDDQSLPKIESLLHKAVEEDRKFARAYLQLGALYTEQKNLRAAIEAYQAAVESAPDLPDAHYRLAQAYSRDEQRDKAQQELKLFQQTSRQAAAQDERERHEIQQFIYTTREPPAVAPAP